jgi:hypothetical protein
MLDPKVVQRYGWAAVAIGGALPILFLPRLIYGAQPPRGDAAFGVINAASVMVALAWAIAFGVTGFRKDDEFFQTRSRSAWYWGSLGGVVAAVVGFALLSGSGLQGVAPGLSAGHETVRAFGLGMAAMLAAQMIGFVGVAAWWRVSRR